MNDPAFVIFMTAYVVTMIWLFISDMRGYRKASNPCDLCFEKNRYDRCCEGCRHYSEVRNG
jgi:hypothetical protein